MSNSISFDFAAYLNIFGRRYLLIRTINPINAAPFKIEINKNTEENPPVVDKIDNAKIANTSCINNIPIIILACNVSSSLLSANNLTITNVLENAKINPI